MDEHSLTELFTDLVEQSFRRNLELRDEEVIRYMAALLFDFTRAEHVYRIRDARGRTIEDIGEMLLESDPLGRAANFDREREVRKHIGDFTLFFAGLFPEALNRWRLRRMSLDSFVDYVRAGKESYYIVSAFNQFEYKSMSGFFKKMSEQFETCVFGLNLVKQELGAMQKESYLRAGELLQ